MSKKYIFHFIVLLLNNSLVAQVSIPTEKCLTNNSFEDRYASYAPNGAHILFESKRDSTWQIYLMDEDGKNVKQLTSGNFSNRRPTWHPNGKRILFESNRNGKFQLFTLTIKSKKIRKLPFPKEGEPIFASFAPNGKTIAVSWAESENLGNIILVNKRGNLVRKITDNNKRNFYPQWSNTGKELVFFSRKDTNNQQDEIYTFNLDTGKETRLTNWPKHNFCPSWSNDNKKIVYVTSMSATRPEIYIMNADGSNPIRLTTNENGETLPNWHPRKDKILITAYRNGHYQICELQLH
ncbi:MAG: DPP IV N-terminal domain-containing protein [Flavobacteriaceae bacterium]